MRNAWKLFEFYGTPVYLKYWFLALILITTPVYLVSIFISIVVHELAHSFVAKKLGYKTDYIFIDIFHGGALIDSSYTKNNKHAFKIAFAGPLSNFMLAAIGFILAVLLGGMSKIILDFMATFIIINLLIGIFNLLPIYPLDGGRISKSLLGMLLKDNNKARLVNGIFSLLVSSALLAVSFYFKEYILAIFSILFVYTSYLEIFPEKTIDNN